MGPSGSGKSTLLSILGCLERPTSGLYRLSGQDVSQFDERKAARVRREHIGVVFQSFNLLPRATSLQNVELPLVYARVSPAERRKRAVEALESVGLLDRADHWQQQRVAVARAVVTRPDVVLADEPTGNLDSVSADEVMDVLTKVHEAGATIVLVTHAREVSERATRIVHMLDGRVHEEELLPRSRHALDGEPAEAAT
jgi:putative ABC transport system ATP-binding protein